MLRRRLFGVLVVAAGLAAGSATTRAAGAVELTAFGDLIERDFPPLVDEGADAEALPRPGDLQALRRAIAEVVAQTGVPGAAVALVGPGGNLVEGFGRAGADTAMDAEARFRVGSITKSFIALAVMRLVERGQLRLQDRVRDLAPELGIENRWERTHPLCVAHLLEHTSGFDEMRFNEIFDPQAGERPVAAILAVNPRSRVPRWPPGTRFSYSQPGYTTAAYLLEKVTGKPWAEVLQTEVFGPLGISASVRFDDESAARLARGHAHGRPLPYVRLLHRPAMNLMISARGMSRLLQLLLGRGVIDGQRYLRAASIERIERSGTLAYGPPSVRYGLGNWGDVSVPLPLRGHGGFMPGYQSVYRYTPDGRFGYAVLVNDSDRWPALSALNRVLLRYLLRDQPLAPRPAVPQPIAALQPWAGHYQLRAPEVEFLRVQSDVYEGLDVRLREGALWLHNGRRQWSVPLVPTGADSFRFPSEYGSSIQFTKREGRRALIVGQTYYEEESRWISAARKSALELSITLLFTTVCIPFFLLLRPDREDARTLVRPALSAACLVAMAFAFHAAKDQAALGARTPLTIAVWLLSLAFGLCSYSAFAHACLTPTTSPRPLRHYALAVSLAAVWLTLHLSRYHLIGLRTWLW